MARVPFIDEYQYWPGPDDSAPDEIFFRDNSPDTSSYWSSLDEEVKERTKYLLSQSRWKYSDDPEDAPWRNFEDLDSISIDTSVSLSKSSRAKLAVIKSSLLKSPPPSLSNILKKLNGDR